MERADGGGAILGAAPAALQFAALHRRGYLGCEDVAAFPTGYEPGGSGNHDRAGVARQSLLLRCLSCGNSDPKRRDQRGMEPAALGALDSRNIACDPV